MHAYRSHTCGALRIAECGSPVRLSGWIHRKRDHGGLLFLDIRDHYGITQCVVDSANPSFKQGGLFRLESVISVDGVVVRRSPQAVNPHLATGEIEVQVQELTLLSLAEILPIPVNNDAEYPEEMRLRYRFLDLRRDRLHENIVLRSKVISSLREQMTASGFIEIQTPILTASSPEGARDFLVPSRLHPGKFYALPQAPQIFKQMLMTAGFDRYFQIAPCFRDEDGRADRSPTEFYQLDIEMSFVTQEDVFAALEPVLHGVFSRFGKGRSVTEPPFPRISYETSMLTYGSDKPDLRNPLEIRDVTDIFKDSPFRAFAEAIAQGSIVRAIPAPGTAARPRSFFDRLGEWAKNEGAPGLAYVIFDEERLRGPLAKFLNEEHAASIRRVLDVCAGDAVVFLCGPKRSTEKLAGATRKKIGEELQMIDTTTFKLCWVVDFPMYELNEETNTIDFSHNPFSMPQGGLEALQTQDPLTIKALQYDIVCNGYELSSGAIRNHVPEIMYAAFAIAGYDRTQVEQRFGGLLNAFKYGAPPHGGSAPGIDRIVMLLADEPNLREIVAFPTTQQGEDLLMQAPASVGPERLKELHIRLDLPSDDPSGGGRPPHIGTQAGRRGTSQGIPPPARSREGMKGCGTAVANDHLYG